MRINFRLSLVYLLVQAHFLLVFLYLNDAVICIYIRLDDSRSFVQKYWDLVVLLIFYLFISIFHQGLVAILGQPGLPTLLEYLERHPSINFGD